MNDSIVKSASMLIINTIYFLGEWKIKFDKTNTIKRKFFLSNGKTSKTDFMVQTFKSKCKYYENESLQSIQLDYKKTGFSAFVILPKPSYNTNDILYGISLDLLNNIKNSNLGGTQLKLYLPKFKINYGSSLQEQLKSLGMINCFSVDADFSNLCKDPLFVSDVIHKTFIEVDENGTEAAAATAIIMTKCNFIIKENIIEMDVNRPFIFIIYCENSNNMIFICKIENP